MKYQILFSLKNNEKISRLLSAAVVIGTFRANRPLLKGRQKPNGRVVVFESLLFHMKAYANCACVYNLCED